MHREREGENERERERGREREREEEESGARVSKHDGVRASFPRTSLVRNVVALVNRRAREYTDTHGRTRTYKNKDLWKVSS